MNVSLICYTTILVCLTFISNAQSFSLKLPQNILNQYSSISISDKNIAVLGADFDEQNNLLRNSIVTKLNFNGEIVWSKSYPDLILRNHFIYLPNLLIEPITLLTNDELIISTSVVNANLQGYQLILLDNSGLPKWSKFIRQSVSTFQPPKILEASHGGFYSFLTIQNSTSSAVISFIHFDLNGAIIFEKQLLDQSGTDMDLYKYHILDEQRIAISKYDYSENESVITLYDNKLNFIESFSVNLKIKNILYDGDKYFIAGEELLFSLFSVSPKILSLNNDFTLNWAKATNFFIFSEYYELSMFGDKLIYKGYENGLNFFALINKDGIIEKGFKSPINNITNSNDFETGKNSNFVYFSLEQNNNDVFLNYVDSTFLPICPSTNFCPDFSNILFDIDTSENIYSPHDLEINIEEFNLEVLEVEVLVEFGCVSDDNFKDTNPFFESPDTVCVNELINISELQNEGAGSVNWLAPGSSLNNSSTFLPPVFFYTQEGTYTITQIVEVNNCASEFSVDIVVQPAIDTNGIQTSFLICKDEPILLEPNIQNVEYLWLSDSSTAESITITDIGDYTLELSNAHCTSTVEFIVSEITLDMLEVDLGADTTICEQKSLVLNPEINPNLEFAWTDGHIELSRLINQSGQYSLRISIGNCNLENTIFIQSEDCSTQIYLPSAFSPNLDEVNDGFFPLGNFFEVLEFQVFDRWGNLVHNNLVPWQGTSRNDPAPIGIYVYTLKIRNTLLDEEEFLKGDVVLMR